MGVRPEPPCFDNFLVAGSKAGFPFRVIRDPAIIGQNQNLSAVPQKQTLNAASTEVTKAIWTVE
jgi:hypothetical protein